ncbi:MULTISPECIES: DMT family transporter [unclassified Bacillus (in: firmicutes)]|uniref:DMT family transporter n=1 Tax=unclassified Bacillus (in: firmicutes) TaxID=185979 RepID=UPI001BE7E3ED|nr:MULTISPECIES: DMT family transporter [unclassified Bacillus (in: firmicutes)]MBT2636851.1 DMT family transporter [Bacillus sp. ISL-39]MBT2663587.1 DMT family transporter [Bacillus sp. ISL-45]
MEKTNLHPLMFIVLVVVTTFLMGSSFTVGKIGLNYVSPLLLVGLRFTIAGLLMAVLVRKRSKPDKLADWGRIFTIGMMQTAGVMGCIFLSLRTITAGESSILTFTNPLMVVVMGTVFLGIRYRLLQWIGAVVGFFGVFITLGFHLQLTTGTLLGLGAAVSWSIGTILIKQWGSRFNVWVLTAYQMLFGGSILLLLGVTLEVPRLTINMVSVTVIFWLAIMASIVQFAIWFYLLNEGDPGKTSAFLFLAPFFGVLTGWVLLDEVVEWYVYAGGALIFIGIFLVNWTFKKGTGNHEGDIDKVAKPLNG